MRRMKFIFRKFKYSRKRTYTLGILFLVLLSLGVGYAFVNATLNITGVLGVASSKWDVHFENIEINDESVEAETDPTITDNTTISFSATLEDPGDMYEYTVDIVNDGTYDAKIDSFTITPTLTSEQQEYFEYEVKYTEGGNLQVGDALDAGAVENIKVYFKYKENNDSSKYPGEDIEFNFSLTLNYIQGKGTTVNHTTLYNVLKTATTEGTYAREYTGEHHDSFTKEPSRKIYHWYAKNNTEGTQILDKNNVIFADHCWQMIRTTDTGGVKMIYNGEAENGKCLNTRDNHVGYTQRTSQNLASNYWYGTDYTYDSTNGFSISGTTEQVTWSEANASGLIGKYTCKNTNVDGTCATLYLVESYKDTSNAYVIPLNSSSNYSQFGTLQFNVSNDLPAYVGYMYGDVYSYSTTGGTINHSFTATQTVLSSYSLNTTYWYADTIDYGTLTANRYSLVSPYQVSSTTDYPTLVGKYTFRNTGDTYTNTSVYYIAGVSGTNMYYKKIENSRLLSDYEPIVFGDSITDNGNGTYTINNPVSVSLSDWYTNYLNYKNKYTCNDSNTTCTNPRYAIATTSTNYTYLNAGEKIMIGKTRSGVTLMDTLLVRKDELMKNSSNYSDYKYTCNTENAACTESNLRMIDSYTTSGYDYAPNHYYGSSVEWDGTNYTLVDPIEIENYNNLNNISTHHYICINYGEKVCSTVAYIYYYTGSEAMYYITLRNGVTTVAQALSDMFTKNTTNSTIKIGVDGWYKKYLIDYDNYIEDTIFCNDRSIQALNGWKDDGGMTNKSLQFKEYNNVTSDLSCANETDKFSISNNKAQLTYKVGLMTSPEMNILNDSKAIKTGQKYWLVSPYYFESNYACGRFVRTDGLVDRDDVYSVGGVRPAISLISGIEYSSGDGSMANPYKIDLGN